MSGNDRIEALESRLAARDREVRDLRARLDASEEAKRDQHDELKSLRRDLALAGTRPVDEEGTLSAGDHRTLLADVNKLHRDLAKAQGDLETSLLEVETLTKALRRADDKVDDLEDSLKHIQSRKAESDQAHREQVDRLNAQIVELTVSTQAHVEAAVAAKEEKAAAFQTSLQAEYAAKRRREEAAQRELRATIESEARRDAARKTTQLQTKLDRVRSELKQVRADWEFEFGEKKRLEREHRNAEKKVKKLQSQLRLAKESALRTTRSPYTSSSLSSAPAVGGDAAAGGGGGLGTLTGAQKYHLKELENTVTRLEAEKASLTEGKEGRMRLLRKLRDREQRAQREKAVVEDELKRANTELADTKAALDKESRAAVAFQSQCEGLERQVRQLEDDLLQIKSTQSSHEDIRAQELDTIKARLMEQVTKVQQQLDQERVRNAEESLKSKRKWADRLNALTDQLADANDKLVKARRTETSLQRDLDEAQALVKEEQDAKTLCLQMKDELEDELLTLDARVKGLERERDALQDTVDTLTAKSDQLTRLTQQHTELQETLSTVEGELAVAQKAVSRLNEDKRATDIEGTVLRKEVEALRVQVVEGTSAKSAHETDLARKLHVAKEEAFRATEDVNRLTQDLDAAKHKIKQLQTQGTFAQETLKREHKALRYQLDDDKMERRKAEQEVADLRQQLRQVRTDADRAIKERDKLQAHAAALTGDLDRLAQATSTHQLTSQLVSETKAKRMLERQNDELRDRLVDMRDELRAAQRAASEAGLAQQVTDAERKQRKAEKLASDTQAKLDEANVSIAELEEAVAQLRDDVAKYEKPANSALLDKPIAAAGSGAAGAADDDAVEALRFEAKRLATRLGVETQRKEKALTSKLKWKAKAVHLESNTRYHTERIQDLERRVVELERDLADARSVAEAQSAGVRTMTNFEIYQARKEDRAAAAASELGASGGDVGLASPATPATRLRDGATSAASPGPSPATARLGGASAAGDEAAAIGLWAIKGDTELHTVTRAPTAASLTERDAFVLRSPGAIFVWSGAKASPDKRARAVTVAESLQKHQMTQLGGSPAFITLEQGHAASASDEDQFWSVLGGRTLGGHIADGEDDILWEKRRATSQRFYTMAQGESELQPMDDDVVSMQDAAKHLTETNVVVSVNASETYVWCGKQTGMNLRKAAESQARELAEDAGVDVVQRVVQGEEPPTFAGAAALAAVEALATAATGGVSDPVADMHAWDPVAAAAKAGASLPAAPKLEVWVAGDFTKAPLPTHEYGQFYGSNSYIVMVRGTAGAPDVLWFWQGDASSVSLRSADQPVGAVARTAEGGSARINLAQQGQEPSDFVALWRGRMVVHWGSRDAFDKPLVSLYKVAGPTATSVVTEQCSVLTASLSGDHVFILNTPKVQYVWSGKQASDAEMQAAAALAKVWKADRTMNPSEGLEPPDFWTQLGGEGKYGASLRAKHEGGNSVARMYVSKKEGAAFVPVPQVAQSSLQAGVTVLVQVADACYAWAGKKTSGKARAHLSAVAEAFSDRDSLLVTTVEAGAEPVEFTALFRGWNRGTSATAQGMAARVGAVLSEYSKTYTVAELRNKDALPASVDTSRLEDYLNEADFPAVLGHTKADFVKLPGWKKNRIKKDAGLF